ncbi:MAG: CoA pyrophosphatase [Desulfobacterales bacterium]|nr:CoA pyrophosphatase [Desulfobacterales bacterium]
MSPPGKQNTAAYTDPAVLKHKLERAALPGAPTDQPYTPACVFLLLFNREAPCILAIQKTDTQGYRWRNQIALPGGHVSDEDATPVDTVFRELEEELGIDRGQVDFIGSMGHFQTQKNTDIEVFLGIWAGEKPIRFDPGEIAGVLEIPLPELFQLHADSGFRGENPQDCDLIYPVSGRVIWGVTARILHFFMELFDPV